MRNDLCFSAYLMKLSLLYREHAPSIIFMDEIDSIGSSRIEASSGGGDVFILVLANLT